jgi:predicted NAD-dependent protein-ADP-ribosyltransferase YbiA (DUF1768 family)
MAKQARKRESRFDEYIGVPMEADLKQAICDIAKSEERDMTSMSRMLLREAILARKTPSERVALGRAVQSEIRKARTAAAAS